MIAPARINRARAAASPVTALTSIKRLLPQTAGAGRIASHRPAPLSSTYHGAGSDTPPFRAPGSRVAFVFQGGGSLAAGQVGMLRALGEAGIEADFVVGSSAGALNAVAFASGPRSDLDVIEQLWRSLRRRHVAPLSARLILQALSGHADGLFSADNLRVLIEDHLPILLQNTGIPAHVVATDFNTGKPVVISRGPSAPALLASSAFPGLYPPVTIDGRTLIDGGVAADVPILQAEQLGATVTYVLRAALSDGPLHGPMAMAYRALGQIRDDAARRDASTARGQVHVLPAPTSAASNPLDFRDTPRLIDEGYQLASRWLANRRDDASTVSVAS